MLEPLHACNLTCTGCGRIREYESTIKQKLTVEECLAAVDECGAPMCQICGGEPMIYPEIGELVHEIRMRRKHVILCTNGMFIEKRLHEFKPTTRLFFNVHLDGLKETHDRAVERAGVFKAAVDRHHRREESRLHRYHEHDDLQGHQPRRDRRLYRVSDPAERGRLHAVAGLRLQGGLRDQPAGGGRDFPDARRHPRQVPGRPRACCGNIA